ncbi:SDR family oxidoreductase [Streptomyces sp. AC550_RSS872]|uniref:SDR family oxidoreductase n=1 Tax=Streptomyces sp. AC550_RSS872 TaxID=2823689 RepID=UPI001C263936|nr:SDR family oxidoreductase [Streptomyces sp. AC550_RSS872]
MSILLTGATGFLGCRLLRELLARPSDELVTVLGRGGEDDLRTRTEAAVTWLGGPPLPTGALRRLRFVSGDITQPGLGLPADDRARVTDGLTQLWHSAALLTLDGDPVPLHRSNVLGTRHVLDLADEAPEAGVVHVSTAYVAGRRLTGHVLEDDLREDSGFQTPYEQSKYTAETMVHAWTRSRGRTATIMRPSLLVTDRPVPPGLPGQPLDTATRLARDGLRSWAARSKGLAGILRRPRRGGDTLRLRVVVNPEGALNLLQADYAAQAMLRAVEAPHEAPVRTLHVTHPTNTPVATLLDACERHFPGLTLTAVPELPDPTPAEELIAPWARILGYSAQRRTYDRTWLLAAVGDLPDPKSIDVNYLARAAEPVEATSG